ncbi:MAG: membrane integrity-associated transporter subunit PqiC [Deltaproteobacteria bacterium]
MAKNSGSQEGVLLGIGPIKFPGYLDRQEIMVRSAQNRFEVSENDRWAEPLEENFARVLTQNLSLLLRTDRIVSYPWPVDRKPTYQIEIEVLRFEANSAREAQLFARWAVSDGGNKKIISVKETRVLRQAKEKSTEGSVAALSEALGDLSREIADAVGLIDGRGKG